MICIIFIRISSMSSVKCHKKNHEWISTFIFHGWHCLVSKLLQYICFFVYRLKPNVNRIFALSTKLWNVHLVILIGYVFIFFFRFILNEIQNVGTVPVKNLWNELNNILDKEEKSLTFPDKKYFIHYYFYWNFIFRSENK